MISLRALRTSVLLAGLAALGACSPPPGAPSPMPPPAPDPSTRVTYGTTVRVVSALERQLGLPLVTVTVADRIEQQTDGAGTSTILTKIPATVPLRLLHPAFLERETRVRIPDAGPVDLSLIPSTLDLGAFEEFAPRTIGLFRWTSNPRLVVLTHSVDFSGATLGFREYPVLDRRISDAQLSCLASGVAASLSDMSGGHLSWTSIEILAVQPGSRFRTDQTPEGTIVVLPSIALGAIGRGIGYSGSEPFVLTRGAVWLLDTQNFCFTSLLYRHELGHALGYQHVTRKASIMGSPGIAPLMDFDRQTIAILFQRPPGSRTPDRDPPSASVNVRSALPTGAEPMR